MSVNEVSVQMDNESMNYQPKAFKKTKNDCREKQMKFRKNSGHHRRNSREDHRGNPWEDPYRTGLSNRQQKEYKKYLRAGHPGREARQMAVDFSEKNRQEYARGGFIRRHTNSFSSGRIEFNESHGAELNEPCGSEVNEPCGSEVATNNNFRSFSDSNSNSIAIIPQNYPSQILTTEHLASLEEAILSEVAKGHTTALAFDGLHFNPGFLVVDCQDASTASWLQGVAPKLKNWCGMELKACQKDQIPKIHSISLFLPKSSGQTVEKTLSLLKAQNVGINTEIWRVTSCKDEEMGQRMNVDIDNESRKAIEANGNAVNYRFGKVLVHEINGDTSEYERDELHKENSRENLQFSNDRCSEAGSSVHSSKIRVKCEKYLRNDIS